MNHDEETIKQLETKLKKLQHQADEYQSILENVRDGIVLLSSTGKVLKVNRRIFDVTGYREDELIGKRFTQLNMFPLRCRVEMAARFTKELAGIKTPPLEVEVYTKAGEKINAEIQGSLFKIKGEGKVSVVLIRDITERKKLEEKLQENSIYLEKEVKNRTQELNITNKKLVQEMRKHKQVAEKLRNSEEKFKILYEFAPDAYYISDLNGKFIDGNRAAEIIIGYKRDELIGKNFLTLKLLHPKDIPKAITRLVQNKLGRSTGPDEFRLIQKDGNQVTLEIRTYPIIISAALLPSMNFPFRSLI